MKKWYVNQKLKEYEDVFFFRFPFLQILPREFMRSFIVIRGAR